MRKTIILVSSVLFMSCIDKTNPSDSIKNVEVKYYENAKTDTTLYSFKNINYNQLCKELHIVSYTPNKDKLIGSPNSYMENISEFPNWTKEESERIWRESNGKLYVDSTDRDYEKYWYNEKGLLEKYENRTFGDNIHNECTFTYDKNNLIKEIQINDIVTETIKYKNSTIIIENNKLVMLLQHNILK